MQVENTQAVQNHSATNKPAPVDPKSGKQFQDALKPEAQELTDERLLDAAEGATDKANASVAAGTVMAGVSAVPGLGSLSPVAMLQMQRAIQQESMMINTASNVMKAKHEANMSVVRNIKGG